MKGYAQCMWCLARSASFCLLCFSDAQNFGKLGSKFEWAFYLCVDPSGIHFEVMLSINWKEKCLDKWSCTNRITNLVLRWENLLHSFDKLLSLQFSECVTRLTPYLPFWVQMKLSAPAHTMEKKPRAGMKGVI